LFVAQNHPGGPRQRAGEAIDISHRGGVRLKLSFCRKRSQRQWAAFVHGDPYQAQYPVVSDAVGLPGATAQEAAMKKMVLALSAVVWGSLAMLATTETAQAVVYCTYIGYPANCVARPGVVLRPRPAVRAATPGVGAPGVGVRPGVPGNRGGPVNRPGRR
jgi:hypothetical protein